MKILAITANIREGKLGGAETHFVEVTKRLSSKVEIVCPKVNFPRVPNSTGLLFILWATPAMVWLAFKNRPDLIWATLDFPQAQVGAITKIFTGVPLYITSQNPLLGEEELVGFGGRFVKFLVTFAFRQANTVAAVSTYSAKLARKFGAKRVVIIPNGVDLKIYA